MLANMRQIFQKAKTPSGRSLKRQCKSPLVNILAQGKRKWCSSLTSPSIRSLHSYSESIVNRPQIVASHVDGGVEEMMRENKRMLERSIREIERERKALQAQEKKLIPEIKKAAKQGQMAAVRVMAKDLIRTRHQITKFHSLKSQLQGISLRVQTLKSNQAMHDAMKGVTKVMRKMNRQMNLPNLQKIMKEFERQNERMEVTMEMVEDTVDDVLQVEEEAEETEELVSQVLDEIGVNLNIQLVKPPGHTGVDAEAKTKVAEQVESISDNCGIDIDLQTRFNNLRKP